jgi:hypothetical protein
VGTEREALLGHLVEAALRLRRIEVLIAAHKGCVLELERSGTEATAEISVLEQSSRLRALLLANRDSLLEEWCSSETLLRQQRRGTQK